MVKCYPGQVALQLEMGYAQGRHEVDLGPSFYGAVVNIPQRKQFTGRGTRDVLRVQLEPGNPLECFVSLSSSWRIVSPGSHGAERRSVDVPHDALVSVGGKESSQPSVLRITSFGDAGLQNQSSVGFNPANPEFALTENDDPSKVALWEWCQQTDATPKNAHAVPPGQLPVIIWPGGWERLVGLVQYFFDAHWVLCLLCFCTEVAGWEGRIG